MNHVRLLTLDDAPAFVALRRRALRTDPYAFSATPDSDPSSRLEVVQQRLTGATSDRGPFIVGAFDAELVGVVGIVRPPSAQIQVWGFYVVPECRGRGVGEMLLGHALAVAKAMPDSRLIELVVSEASSAAIRIYRKLGFRDVPIQSKPGSRDMELHTA